MTVGGVLRRALKLYGKCPLAKLLLCVFDQLMLSILRLTDTRHATTSSAPARFIAATPFSVSLFQRTGLTFAWRTALCQLVYVHDNGKITGVLTALVLMPIWMIAPSAYDTLSPLLKYQDASENLMSAEVAIDGPVWVMEQQCKTGAASSR